MCEPFKMFAGGLTQKQNNATERSKARPTPSSTDTGSFEKTEKLTAATTTTSIADLATMPIVIEASNLA